MTKTNRIIEAYRALGRILNNPPLFGLGDRAPRLLVDEVTKTRKMLMEELIERKSWPEEEEDFLAAELSQDADRPAA